WASILDQRLRNLVRICITAIVLIISTLLFFDYGTRSIFALVVLPATAVFLLNLWKRSQIKAILASVLVGGLAFLAFQFQMLYRADFTRGDISHLIFQNWFTLGGTIDYYKETL